MTLRFEVDEVRDILNKYPEAYAKILDDGDIYDNEKLYEELYEYFQSEMPYGVQKARDGDPVEWITMRLDDLGLLTLAEDISKDKHQGRVDVHSYLDEDENGMSLGKGRLW